MPLIINKTKFSAHFGVWDIRENVSALRKDFQIIPEIKNEIRQKQWLAARKILTEWNLNFKIEPDENGKPHFLNSDLYLSFSHCGDKAATVVSKKKCGVDIEIYSEKAERIASRFLSEQEKKNCHQSADFTLYWMAKEAVYKAFGENEITFKQDIFIQKISFEENNDITLGAGSIKKGEKKEIFTLYFEKHTNFAVCVAVLKEKE